MDTLRAADINCQIVKLPAGSLARRKLFGRAVDSDGVFLHKKALNFFDAFWLRKYSRKIIYDFDDAVMYSARVPERSSPSHFKPFRRTVGLADMIIAGNSYLAEHAREFNPNVEIVPTGLDTNAYKLDAGPKKDGIVRLAWIGSKSTLKYLAEIKPALEEIGSRFDNVILRIICDDFFDLHNMEVEKHEWSEETHVLDLAASDIGLAPLPDNRFTRGKCGFKVLQYAAAGLPVVASPVGVNSDYVHSDVSGFLATGDHEWVERLAQLIDNRELRKDMGSNGRELVERFNMRVVGKQLAMLILKCLHNITS
jgi:glycosyltransferase involved in cell wall biosynthesis